MDSTAEQCSQNKPREINTRWITEFTIQRKPNLQHIIDACGATDFLLVKLINELEKEYNPKSEITFSKCSGQPGWNLKYKKPSKSLCTIYPMEDYFIVLAVVGNKEKPEFEATIDEYSEQVIDLYNRSKFVCGGHWLMIAVTGEKDLEDVLRIISLRMKK